LTDLKGLAENECGKQLARLGKNENNELWQRAIRIMKEMLQSDGSISWEHFEDLAGPFYEDLLRPNVFVNEEPLSVSFDSTIMKARAARMMEEIAPADV